MNATTYKTNELELTLPTREFIDVSINSIRFPSLEASLVVSRGLVPEGASLDILIEDQVNKLGTQVNDLQFDHRRDVMVGLDRHIRAIEMQCRFMRGEERIHQLQLVFIIPGLPQMLAITYTRLAGLTSIDLEHWETVKNSLNPLHKS